MIVSIRRLGAAFLFALPLHAAFAHPRLMHAVPAAGSRVPTPPRELILTFNESVTAALSRLTLLDAAQQPVAIDALRAAPEDGKTMRAGIHGALAAGRYTVKWQAAGADGHPMRGDYTFVVETGAASGATAAPPPQAGRDEGFGVESPLFVAIRFVQSVAVVGLLGLLALHLVVLPRVARQDISGPIMASAIGATVKRAVPWAAGAVWAVGGVTAARLVAQYVAIFGPNAVWSRASLGALLLHSTWGRGWWLAFTGFVIGLWAVRRIRREPSGGWWMLVGAALALTLSLAMSGHAAAARAPGLAITVHALHVIGAGGWVGSLAALMIVAVPAALRHGGDERHAVIAGWVRAFSPTALGFAALLTLTGIVAGWRNVGSLDALPHSAYGQVLLTKLGVLSVAAGTGAYNWKRVLPRLGQATATGRLRASAALELTAALVVLIVTAVLVATPMPADIGRAMAR